jgi:ribosomal protein L28
MTTTALKAIDKYGGIDNYVLSLDDRSVSESKYITKRRLEIATALNQQGALNQNLKKKFNLLQIDA